jgi:hypothetical protein
MKSTNHHHNTADQATKEAHKHYQNAWLNYQLLHSHAADWLTADEKVEADRMLSQAKLHHNLAAAYAQTCWEHAPDSQAAAYATNALLSAAHARAAAKRIEMLNELNHDRFYQACLAEELD